MSYTRKNKRIEVDQAVLIHLDTGITVQARMLNLSSGGIAVLYPAPADIGATMTLQFDIPDNNDEAMTIHCQAIVRHCMTHKFQYITGLQFDQLSTGCTDIINMYVHRTNACFNPLAGAV